MSDLAGRVVLVTGADGFIGSHLVERLVDRGRRRPSVLPVQPAGKLGLARRRAGRRPRGHRRPAGRHPRPAASSPRPVVAWRSSSTSRRSSRSRTRTSRLSHSCRRTCTGTLNVLEAVRRHGVGTPRPHLHQRGLRDAGPGADPRGSSAAGRSPPTPRPRSPPTSSRSPTTGASTSRSRSSGRSTPTARGSRLGRCCRRS